jgi:hypothetical protein
MLTHADAQCSIVKGLDVEALAKQPRLVANVVNAFAKARVRLN